MEMIRPNFDEWTIKVKNKMDIHLIILSLFSLFDLLWRAEKRAQ